MRILYMLFLGGGFSLMVANGFFGREFLPHLPAQQRLPRR